MNNSENWIPFEDAVEICDYLRKPVNSKERANRIKDKKNDELYPYYGATGQVGYIDDFLMDGEYVLLGEDGAPFLDAYAQKAYIVNGKAWVNNHAHVLKSKGNSKFLCYYLNYFNYKEYVSGTTRLKLTQTQMKRIKIPNLSIKEQEQIVVRIEELFSELDNAEDTLQKTKQQLSVYRQVVLKEAFDMALNGNELVPIESFLSTKRKGMSTGPFGTMIKKHEHQRSGIPMLGIENIGKGKFVEGNKIFVTPQKADELKAFVLMEGDIIISRSGTVGEICVVPQKAAGALMSTNLMRVVLNTDKIHPDYFVYLFQSKSVVYEQVKELCRGSTRIFLNQTILKKIRFPVPSLKMQEQIIDKIESRLSVCNSIENTITTSLRQLQAMRRSILREAFERAL